MKKVAIIIPVYNVEKYINESVDSVINQTYKNLEIILVNDGSTDNSLHICREYLEKDERIHIINKENGGLSSARNAGLRYIFNENIEDLQIIENKKLDEIDYIQFFDSDDIMLNNCVETSISVIKDSDFTSFNYFHFYDGSDEWINGLLNFYVDDYQNPVKCRDFLLYKIGSIISWGWRGMIKKEILKELRFKENMEYEDALFGTKLFYYAKTVQFIKENLILYRLRDNSIMDRGKKRKIPYFMSKLFKNSGEDYIKEYFKFHSYLTLYEELNKDPNLKYIAPKLYNLNFINIVSEDPLNIIGRLTYLINPNKEKLLSIIIPVYPDISMITNLVKKLYALDKEKECEIIIINDGCDNEINEEILLLDNVIYHNNLENKGRSFSRNVGLSKASGKYVTFVDADDFIKDNFIQILKHNILKFDSDYYAYRCSVNNKYIQNFYHSDAEFKYNKFSLNEVDTNFINYFLCKIGNSSIGSKIFKKDIIDKNDLKFEEDINYAEDLCFILDFLINCKTAINCPEIIYEYNYQNNKYDYNTIVNNFKKIYYLKRFNLYKNSIARFISKTIPHINNDPTNNEFLNELNSIKFVNKVSVIIPVYNVEKYIEKCMMSVINQTYKNLEIIVINDGTMDKSMEIVEKYKDDRFIIINQENKGLSAARNAGLDVASGDYIYFLDSDDWIDSGYIEEMVFRFTSDISYDSVCNANHVLYHSDYTMTNIAYTITKDKIICNPECGEFYNPYGICFFMFKRTFLNENNIRFIEGSNNEDVGFQALCAPFIRKCLFYGGSERYNVIKRRDSITGHYGNNFQIDVCDQFGGVVQFYKKYNINYPLPYFLILGYIISYNFENEKDVIDKLISIMKRYDLLDDLKQFPSDLLSRNNIDINNIY